MNNLVTFGLGNKATLVAFGFGPTAGVIPQKTPTCGIEVPTYARGLDLPANRRGLDVPTYKRGLDSPGC